MQLISRFFIFIGIIFILLGLLPLFVSHPQAKGVDVEAGNAWEFIVSSAYDGQIIFLVLGVLLVAAELYLDYKRKQLE